MKRLLPVLSLLVLPAYGQWVTGPEQIVSSPAIGTFADTRRPVVAASQSNFLALWANGPFIIPDTASPISVMPFGSVGPQSPTATEFDDVVTSPGLASNGSEYLMAWMVDGSIHIRRLARDGQPLGPATAITPQRPNDLPLLGGPTVVMFDGAEYLIAALAATAKRSAVQSSIDVAVVSPAGDLVRSFSFGDGESLLDAAAVPGVMLVTSIQNRASVGRLVTAAGKISQPFPMPNDPSTPYTTHVASDGTSFLVSWIDRTSALRAARIDTDGNIGPVTTVATQAQRHAVAWNGRELVLSWTAPDGTYTTALRDAGALPALRVAGSATGVAVGGVGGVTALVTTEGPAVGRFLSQSEAADPFPLSQIVLGQTQARLAGNILYYLQQTYGVGTALVRLGAVVRETRAYDVVAGDPSAVAVHDGTAAGVMVFGAPDGPVTTLRPASGDSVALASNGRTRLVAYPRNDAVWYFRVNERGAPLDADSVQLSLGRVAPADIHAVWRGDAFVVTWREGDALKSARVAEDGSRGGEVLNARNLGIVAGIAASGGVTAAAWSSTDGLHVTAADPERPNPNLVIANPNLIPGSVSIAGVPDGFDVTWISRDRDRTAWHMIVARDFTRVSSPESLGPMPADAVTFVYGQMAPQLVLYSKGEVIAARTIAKTARRRAAAAP